MSNEPNALIELFRAEVESHSESLTTSLMALERDPADSIILETIMRSAHSLKGAARIVGVNAAVEVAHVMEDCLVAAQRGELSIQPSDIDVLLEGVDLLVQISEATKTDDAQWSSIENKVQKCVRQLRSIRAGVPIAQVPLAHAKSDTDAVVAKPKSASVENHSFIDSTPSVIPTEAATAPAVNHAEPTVLTFGQTLDRVHADEMRRALLAALQSGADRVRYDLSKTTDLDPVGLAFLAASRAQVHELTLASLEFSPVSEEVQLVLRLSGISPS